MPNKEQNFDFGINRKHQEMLVEKDRCSAPVTTPILTGCATATTIVMIGKLK